MNISKELIINTSPSVSVASRQELTHKGCFAVFCSFVLGRSAAWLVLCIIILAPRFLISYMYGIILFPIGKAVPFASHSIIINKHIVIDERLILFTQRNTYYLFNTMI